jgi:hypothetical protein
MIEEIRQLLNQQHISVEEVLSGIALLARQHEQESLPFVIELSEMDGLFDEIIAVPALLALVAWGESGLDSLKEHLLSGLHSTDAQKILLALAAHIPLSEIKSMFVPSDWLERCGISVTPVLSMYALQILRGLLLEQAIDREIQRKLIINFAMETMVSVKEESDHSVRDAFLSLLLDSHLTLNKQLLEQFETLLATLHGKEEEIHQFLFDHPIFLDPLAIELRSKHELGDDFITDFVVRRVDGTYILVEIEKSTDRLFTVKGRIHSELNDAIGQLRDFQAWIADNRAYAESKLPGIRRPEGLVVIGRHSQLSPELEKRLDEENFSRRGHIKVITYDDLLNQARVVYENLLAVPIRFRAKGKVQK